MSSFPNRALHSSVVVSSDRAQSRANAAKSRPPVTTRTPDSSRHCPQAWIYYVYAYVDPLDNRIFYVRKRQGPARSAPLGRACRVGKGRDHQANSSYRQQPRIEILAHGLRDAKTALQVEAAVIDALGMPSLTNQVRGWGSSRWGRLPLEALIALYRRRPVRIKEPSILIRINELYRPQMTASELYDATRGVWKLGSSRTLVKYAFAVFEGIIREVYEITEWLPAGSTFSSRDPRGVRSPKRWEFVGPVAPDALRRRYINRDVSSYFKRGNRSPVIYVMTKWISDSWPRCAAAPHLRFSPLRGKRIRSPLGGTGSGRPAHR